MSSRASGQQDVREPLLRRSQLQQPTTEDTSSKLKHSDEFDETRDWQASREASASFRASHQKRSWLFFGSGFVLALVLSACAASSGLWSNTVSNQHGNDGAFPPPEEIGHRGPTSTGIEPFAVATAAALPKLRHHYPVEVGHNNISAETIFSNSGNLAPPRSASFGLPHASERIPDHCQLDQVQILHRHGQRYPTGGFETEAFAEKIKAAGSNLQASGAMAFLMDWEYPLGAEILTPAGRLQLFQLGTSMRFKYGGLLDKMRSLSHLPVFRTTSQDRMLHSALNFAAGFFGIPYEDQYRQEVIIEEKGGKYNNTLVSQHNCPNEGRSVNRLGLDKGFEWVERSLSGTAHRLQAMVSGVEINHKDVLSMLFECSLETVAVGYSAFCPLFTKDDFDAYGYFQDLLFHYSHGFGSPVSSAIGISWVKEVVSRLTQERIAKPYGAINTTLDSDPVTFPLDQSIYVDASHDTSITAMLVAMNFTTLGASGPLPTTHIPDDLAWHTADISPFATCLTGQIMTCASPGDATAPLEKAIRWSLNDGILPLTGVKGCPEDADGLCPLSTWTSSMQERIDSIDIEYDCNADYEPSAEIRNGRPPHQY